MRYTSQGCSCSFSYDITCPQLKVPNQPTITAPAENAVLSSYTLNQCGNAIWAFGDTLAAVNGIVTGSDSALDAACTHNCCFTRSAPCVQFNLCTCPEIYDNPGLYSHRIRYVTASYEVSEFSEPGTFCIGLSCYCSCPCTFAYCTNSITNPCYTEGSCQAGKCIIIESSVDSDFSTIAATVTCSGSCIAARSPVYTDVALNPDSNGTFLSAGSTIYTRVCTVGGYNCDETSVSPTACHTVDGCLYVFALCDGVNQANANIEGSCCIQLYALYKCDAGHQNIPAQGMCFKFDVSPFCDFCSDVKTSCGYNNVYIPKSQLAGAGACTNYYVRACVLGTSACTAPNFVRCVHLGNITRTCTDQVNNWCNNPDCNFGRCCAGTINWDGTFVMFAVGAGGVGAIALPTCCDCGIMTVANCYNCYRCSSYCCIWRCLTSGVSGCFELRELSGKNGCCYFMMAGHGNCGSLRCYACAYGCSSFLCICGDACYCTGDASPGTGGLGGTANPFYNFCQCCLPLRCYGVSTFSGKSGNILCLDTETTRCNVGQTFYSGCQLHLNSTATPDKTEWFHQIGLRDSDIGYCVCDLFANRCFGHYCGTDTANMTCSCTGNFRAFCAEDITACCCRKICNTINTIHQNVYGLGGFAARMCIRDVSGLCTAGCVCGLCNPTQGFGYGAGGPSFSLSHTQSHSTDQWFNNCFCSCAVMCWAYGGQAGLACCETCMPIWNGNCCGTHGSCGWAVLMPTGGSAGVIWLCNDFYETHNGFGYWRGRHGLVAIACQDYA